MIQLSAVIITFNEEAHIQRCLDSLRGVADEIIVVDSGSTDNTRNICLAHGVIVKEQAWLGYGAQKNEGHKLATKDYILSIDADEALSDTLRESLLKEKNQPQSLYYTMDILPNYCGKWIRHCGWYPGTKLRMWKKDAADWNTAYVHESLILRLSNNPVHLNGDILHYSYTSISQHMRKTESYSSLLAAQYYQKGKKASILKLIFASSYAFFRTWILRGGILDGYYGFVISTFISMGVFVKYAKLRELWKQHHLQK